MTAVDIKSDFGYTEVAVEDLCRTSYMYADEDDDDIICLDSDVLPPSSSPPSQDASPPEQPKLSRLLLQIVRLHLSEQCISPGCSAIMEETQNLRRKMAMLEELSSRLRRACTTQKSDIARLNEETEKQRRKIAVMEGVIKKQSDTIRDAEAQIAFLQRTARPLAAKQSNYSQQKVATNSQIMNRPFHNIPRPQLPVVVQRRVRSEANLPNLGGGRPSLANGAREHAAQTPVRPNGMAQTPTRTPQTTPTLSRMLQTPSRTPQTPSTLSRMPQTPHNTSTPRTPANVPLKSSRVKIEVPFANEKSLINFDAPIENPTLDYPVECQRCRIAGPNDLSLEIKTEPSNFLLTKKVQGVIKCSSMKPLPKKVRMFCYLESAVKVRRWTSSLLYNFSTAEKLKFEIIFSKEQQIARYDRIVTFAYGTFGPEKYVTDRIVFNIGQSANCVNESHATIYGGNALHGAEPMETDYMLAPSAGRNGVTSELDDSNFEVYRP